MAPCRQLELTPSPGSRWSCYARLRWGEPNPEHLGAPMLEQELPLLAGQFPHTSSEPECDASWEISLAPHQLAIYELSCSLG